VAAIAAFVPLMTLTTVLHLDKFHLSGDDMDALVAGWAWLLVYAVVPFVVSRTDRERLHPQSNDTLAADIRKRFTAGAAPQNPSSDEKSSSESSLDPRTVGAARMSHDDRSHNRRRRLPAARSASSAIGAHYRRK